LMGSMVLFRARWPGDGEVRHSSQHSFLVGEFLVRWFYWVLGPVERVALWLGLGPFAFNLLGLTFGCAAGVLFGLGRTEAAGWFVLTGGVADIMDGKIARTLGVSSRKGAFIDSTFDRFAEATAFGGLAVMFSPSALGVAFAAAALGASQLVSYVRARGESLGQVYRGGVMQRPQRVTVLAFGAIFDTTVAQSLGWSPGTFLLALVGFLAAASLATAAHRVLWIAARLSPAGGRGS